MAEENTKTRGRPKSIDKRIAIMRAAGELFLNNALDDISMDELAKKAKVSKITVYNHFADKHDLLKTMIEEKLSENLSTDLYNSLDGTNPSEEFLKIALGFVTIIYSKEGMNMYRTVVAESKRGNDVPHMFYSTAIEPSHILFEDYLSKIEAHKNYSFPDKALAGDVFFTLLKGDRYMREVTHIAENENHQDAVSFAKERVGLFLKLFKQPAKNIILSDKKQAYFRDLEKMLAGCDICRRTTFYMKDKATHPHLKLALDEGIKGIERGMENMKAILERHNHVPRQGEANALEAICKEAEEDVCANYASDDIRDSMIISNFSRICHYASAGYSNYISMAHSMGLNDDAALFKKDLEDINEGIERMSALS